VSGNIVPVQLDIRPSQSAGEAADEAVSVAQCSFTSRLMLVTAEDGLIPALGFQ